MCAYLSADHCMRSALNNGDYPSLRKSGLRFASVAGPAEHSISLSIGQIDQDAIYGAHKQPAEMSARTVAFGQRLTKLIKRKIQWLETYANPCIGDATLPGHLISSAPKNIFVSLQ